MKRILLAGLILLVLNTGCDPVRVTSTFDTQHRFQRDFKKILVLGIIRDTEYGIQAEMENHLVGDLQDLGYVAISSLKEYGPDAFDKMDESEVTSKLKDKGVDAVITLVLLNKEKESKYVYENIYYSPYGYYYDHFCAYSETLYRRVYEPGYYGRDMRYFWESNFYDMSSQQLVYSLKMASFDPAVTSVMGHEFGQLIVKKFVEAKVLKQQKDIGQVIDKY